LKLLYKPKTKFLIGGDITTEYVIESTQQHIIYCIEYILQQEHKSGTAIDDIFVDNSRLEPSYTASPKSGLSDHDAQFFTCASTNKIANKRRKRLINSNSLTNFQTLLEQEMWGFVYQKPDTNCMFNLFPSTFLHNFEARYPVK